jgi:DNA-binding transcriptional LysR family regulator
VIEVESMEAAVALAARGLGDTVVPRAAFGRRHARTLHAASFAEPLYDTFAFIARHGAPLSPAVRAFVAIAERHLGKEAEPLYAGGPSESDG